MGKCLPIEILVVEDKAGFRETLVDALQANCGSHDVKVLQACHGEEAVSLINERTILFLDLEMPVMDGYAVLEYLRREGIAPKGVIVMGSMAGDPMESARVRRDVETFYQGPLRYLPKPFGLDVLEKIMESFDGMLY